MKMRLVLGALCAVLLLGLLADVMLWRLAEGQLAAGWESWTAMARAQGWTISAGQTEGGGWPLVASRIVPEVFLSGAAGDLPGGVTWSTDRIVLTVSLLHPRTLTIAAEGMQRLRLGDMPDIPYTADLLRVAVPLRPGVPARAFTLRAANLRAGLPADIVRPGAITIGRLDVRAAWTPAAQQNEPAVTLDLDADEIALPAGPAWPLGPRVGAFRLTGTFDGPLPRVPGLAARATAWRDGGGTVDIRRLGLDWGPLQLTATATLALDEQMQPMGTGTAHIAGADPALDMAAGNHALSDKAALAAKAVLALMAPPGQTVDVPLTLQDRRLALGRIPLVRLPPVVWAP